MAKVRLIPYGIANFAQVRREDKYYSDKTMYLEKMENTGNFLFLVRPRRFGKSVFLTMMQAYYDINRDKEFDSLFAGLYVHGHPTPERARYQVLYLDFSQIGGDSKTVQSKFEQYGCNMLNDFAARYNKFYTPDFLEAVYGQPTFAAKLTWISTQAKNLGYQLYLIIDEYDNFTNNILNYEGTDVYRALTHSTGFYRDVFKLFKPNFNRIFMMGVSPVTLDDLTSGFNIALNITMDSEFNMMLGFSEIEVREMIRYYKDAGVLYLDEDYLVADMKPWYDNYCFARASFGKDPEMFNCDMVCYYLNYCIRQGTTPETYLDPNTATDYKKLKNLVMIDSSDPRRASIIHKIAEEGSILANVVPHVPAERIADESNFVSLLYYYGMLTISGIQGARLRLGIPNNNVRIQYYEYLREEYGRRAYVDITALQDGFDAMAFDGNWKPLVRTITDDYKANTAVRSLIEGERNLQGFMSAFLSMNPYYILAPEVEMAHGYCDFFMLPLHSHYPEVAHSYILELKYLKTDATDSDASRQWAEAVEQSHCYATDRVVRESLDGTALHLLVVQIKGSDLLKAEEV